MAWTSAGSLAVTSANPNIVGTGTLFLGAFAGDGLWTASGTYEIATVTDNTHIALATNYTGSTGTLANGAWRIIPTSPLRSSTATVAAQIQTLIAAYTNLVVATGASTTITLNKTASTNSSGLIFQDSGTAFARVGGFGADNLHLQVSNDGTTWLNGISVTKANGQVSLSLGTAIVPALVFNGDTNTGIFGGTDIIAFTTAGTESMRILANGNVGIGTTTPSGLLTVVQTYADAASSTMIAPAMGITLTANNANQFNGIAINAAVWTIPTGKTLSGSINAVRIDGFANTTLFVGSVATQTSLWSRAGILSSNAAATISSARALLAEIHNDIAGATVTNLYGVEITGSTIIGNGNGIYACRVDAFAVTGTYAARYDFYAGNSDAANYFAGQIRAGTSTASAPAYAFDSERDCGMYSNGTNVIGFATGGIGVMSMDANHNVQIGSSGVNVRLYVSQNEADSGTVAARFDNVTATAPTLQIVNHATTGNNLFANFYTEVSPTLRGSISYNRTSAVVAYNTTSDQRIKEVIDGAFDFSSIIDGIEPHHYRRTDITDMTVEAFGFFAQELYVQVPGAVCVGSDAGPGEDGFVPWQVDASQLVPYLWAEVRALRTRVASLETH